MRFSSFTITSLLLSAYMTMTLAVDTTDPNHVGKVDEEMSNTVYSTLALHKFPALFTFELDADYAETPELIAQIEEAFILSANEVHQTADIKFISAFIKSAMHEHLSPDDDPKSMMMLDGDGKEQGEYYGEDEEQMEGAAVVAAVTHDNAGLEEKRRFLRKNRRPKNDFMWRPYYNTLTSVGCNFCLPEDDDATTATVLARPLEQGSAFYELKEGRDIQLAWQRKLCQKLRSIHPLQKARRCFIYFDVDHDEPGDDAQDLVLTASP